MRSLNLIFIFLIGLLVSCTNDNSEFNDGRQNDNILKNASKNEQDINYYLGNSNTVVAFETAQGLQLNSDIVGKQILDKDENPVTIKEVSFEYTKKDYMNYIIIVGTSKVKNEEGTIENVNYHMGFPIFNEPNYQPLSVGEETHTCTSSDSWLYHCDGVCTFHYDEWNCIDGCRCSKTGGICVHSVSTTVEPCNLSLVALF